MNVPYFVATVERRENNRLSDSLPANNTPGLVIGGQPWEPQPVYAFSREVAVQGVRPGMSLRLAHVLSPQAHFIPATPPRYYNASGEITDVLTDFTHLIEPEELWIQIGDLKGQKTTRSTSPAASGPPLPTAVAFGRSLPARYTLDLESLPQAEALALAQEVGRAIRRHTRLAPAIGLAESKFAAQVAATLTRPNHARPVSRGEEAAFLAGQTVHFLPLDKETTRRLSLLGIRTMGQLASLPLATLQTQLGARGYGVRGYGARGYGAGSKSGGKRVLGREFIPLYRLLQGQGHHDPHLAVHSMVPDKQERLSHTFEEPVNNSLVLERVLVNMARELAGRLQEARLEGRTLALTWEIDGAGSDLDQIQGERAFSLPNLGSGVRSTRLTRRRPTADPEQLTDSLRELFYQHCQRSEGRNGGSYLSRGVLVMSIVMDGLTPISTYQLSLFDRLKLEPARISQQVQEALNNLLAKHGLGCFFRPLLTDTGNPLPERRFRLQELKPA